MQVHQNFSLKPFNTFGVNASARFFGVFRSVDDLQSLLEIKADPFLVLGGGSNILFCKNVEGLVARNDIGGIAVVREDKEFVYVKSGAGVVWDEFVQFCVARNWGGVENLSLIPGCVGASPIQNIGAYGVEIKDVFEELEAFDLEEKKLVMFKWSDCEFGYRESVFKNKYKGRFVILNVTFKLRKKPVFDVSYGAIRLELERMGVKELCARSVANAVITIRRSKLPDPQKLGNAGSFFKNPIINNELLSQLTSQFDLPFFSLENEQYKVPAGWLIEKCGWKGARDGDAGCYEKQALVLVNYGHATGQDIYKLSCRIIESIKIRFNISLEREVNLVGC